MSLDVGDLLGKLGGAFGGSSQPAPAPAPQQQAAGGNATSSLITAMLPALLPMLMNGGLSKILGGMQSNGLVGQVDSWTKDGDNQQVTPSQVKEAVDDKTLDEVAQKAGVSKDEAAAAISQLLPTLVDSMSPKGELPDQKGEDDMLGSLVKQLGKAIGS